MCYIQIEIEIPIKDPFANSISLFQIIPIKINTYKINLIKHNAAIISQINI